MHYSLYQTYRVMHRESAGCYTGTLFFYPAFGLIRFCILIALVSQALLSLLFLSVSHQCIIVVTNMHLFYAETMV